MFKVSKQLYWSSRHDEIICRWCHNPLVVKLWTKQPWVKIENLLFAVPISFEIMDGFWCSRGLNNHIDLPNMIGTFASGANASLVAKNWTKKIISLPLIKSSPVDGFWCLRCLYDHINQPDIIGSLVSGANVSLVAKIWTKDLATSCSVNRI